ncbi:MAG TPA: hypothetical protein ENK85_10230 [Saprospiraceae bacterium]|nr:hypothetical protein [Saprospiraceae bacterium]
MKTKIFFIWLASAIIWSCGSSNHPKVEEQSAIQKPQEHHPKEAELPKKKMETHKPAESTPSRPPMVKYGIQYTIPETWKEATKETKATDLKGNITAIQLDYTDSTDQSVISLVFHPGEKGRKLYEFQSKNLDKQTKKITIGGKEAIQKTVILKRNGKGEKLKSATKRIVVSLLVDGGEMDFILNSKSPVSEKSFNDFISKIEFQTR